MRVLKVNKENTKNILSDLLKRSPNNYDQYAGTVQGILDEIKEKGDEAYKLVALPGTSEHQTGLAVDFAYYENGIYNDDVKEDDEEAIWLKNNCWKYGFILRYPKGKEHITGYKFEPWHFRFVGPKLAKKIYEENITLEEYYQNFNIIL